MANWNEGQEKVINWRNSFILVSAAAGSGKTAALVERIIRMVIDDRVDINRLIVVTFTKAAASEMKERLSNAIYDKIDESEDDEVIAHLEKQLSLVNTALVCTIDSFCQYIIKNYFYAYDGLDPDFTVIEEDDNKILLNDCLEEVLAERYEKSTQIIEERLKNRGNAEKRAIFENGEDAEKSETSENTMESEQEESENKENETEEDDTFTSLVNMLSGWKNDEGLRSVVLDIFNKSCTQPNPDKWLRQLEYSYTPGMKFEDFPWVKMLLEKTYNTIEKDRMIAEKIYKKLEFNDALAKYREKIEKDLEILEDLNHFGKDEKPDFSTYSNRLSEVKFASYTGAKNISDNDKKIKELTAEMRGIYAGAKGNIMEIYNNYYNVNDIKKLRALEGIHNEDETPVECIQFSLNKMYPYVHELIDIVIRLREVYANAKKEMNVVDFNDMEHFALAILTDKDEDGNLVPSKVACELRAFYKQIMIDEYQDSNLVQEAILSSIAGVDVGDTGKKSEPYMFMVGDIKQSIYSFRYARPDLFLKKYNTFMPSDNFSDNEAEREGHEILLVLDRNYRSRTSVLETVNKIFKRLMTREFGGIDYDDKASLKYGGIYGKVNEAGNITGDKAGLEGAGLGYDKGDKSPVGTGLEAEDTSEESPVLEPEPEDTSEESPKDTFTDDKQYNSELILIDTGNLRKRIDKYDNKLPSEENPFSEVEVEAAQIAKRINDLINVDKLMVSGKDASDKSQRRPVTFGDIVILHRSAGKVGDVYKKVFSKAGISVKVDVKSGFYDTVEIMTVVNYLRIIDNPLQDIPLVSVLRSSFVGLDEKELAEIKLARKSSSYFYDKLEMCENPKIVKFLDELEGFRQASVYKNSYEILYELCYDSGYINLVSAQEDGERKRANIESLIKIADAFVNKGKRSVSDFTFYLDSLSKKEMDRGETGSRADLTNAVRIMTIHKSKGLEFPVVFLAGMSNKFNLKDATGKVIVDSDYGLAINDINYNVRYMVQNGYKGFVVDYMKNATREEEQRILYVALTRAREKLIMVSTFKFTGKELYSKDLNSYLNDIFINRSTNYSIMDRKDNYSYWVLSALADSKNLNDAIYEYGKIMDEELEILNNEGETTTGEVTTGETVSNSVSAGEAPESVEAPESKEASESAEMPESGKSKEDINDLFGNNLSVFYSQDYEEYDTDVRIINKEEVIREAVKLFEKNKDEILEKKENVNEDYYRLIRDLIKKEKEFIYPYTDKFNLPSKIGVSQLKSLKTEEERKEENLVDRELFVVQDKYEEDLKTEVPGVKGALRGTIYHKLMSMLDFKDIDSYRDSKHLNDFIDKLERAKILPENVNEIIDADKISAFVDSDSELINKIRNAATNGTLWVEQPFIKDYNVSDVFNVEENQNVIVQGVIDLFFMDEDNEFILVDYKTDRLNNKNNKENLIDTLKERYDIQLKLYAKAIEDITGRNVKER
ncbi:MAG: UvrD-helicase domain-containing protein, partial [Lachnospiraceae bacterium]|nr:UvrD-helicase domain-containing protein [Lachnospiraceae bacterium]